MCKRRQMTFFTAIFKFTHWSTDTIKYRKRKSILLALNDIFELDMNHFFMWTFRKISWRLEMFIPHRISIWEPIFQRFSLSSLQNIWKVLLCPVCCKNYVSVLQTKPKTMFKYWHQNIINNIDKFIAHL